MEFFVCHMWAIRQINWKKWSPLVHQTVRWSIVYGLITLEDQHQTVRWSIVYGLITLEDQHQTVRWSIVYGLITLEDQHNSRMIFYNYTSGFCVKHEWFFTSTSRYEVVSLPPWVDRSGFLTSMSGSSARCSAACITIFSLAGCGTSAFHLDHEKAMTDATRPICWYIRSSVTTFWVNNNHTGYCSISIISILSILGKQKILYHTCPNSRMPQWKYNMNIRLQVHSTHQHVPYVWWLI